MADLQSRTGYVLLVLSLTVLGVTLAFNHQFGADTVKLGSGAITFELNYARLPGNYFAFSHTHSYSLMRTHLQAHAHTTLININTQSSIWYRCCEVWQRCHHFRIELRAFAGHAHNHTHALACSTIYTNRTHTCAYKMLLLTFPVYRG